MNAIHQFDANRVHNARSAIPSATPEELAAQLPEIGEGLAAALVTLSRNPQPDACETLAARLTGTARVLMLMRSAVLANSQPRPAT